MPSPLVTYDVCVIIRAVTINFLNRVIDSVNFLTHY